MEKKNGAHHLTRIKREHCGASREKARPRLPQPLSWLNDPGQVHLLIHTIHFKNKKLCDKNHLISIDSSWISCTCRDIREYAAAVIMVLKRKRSESEISFSSSSAFSSPPRPEQNGMFDFGSVAMPSLRLRPTASQWANAAPSHLPSRTMKRVRDNRPSEDEVYGKL